MLTLLTLLKLIQIVINTGARGVPELQPDAEVARKFGSKLAAMAARLTAIREQGEKAIVFWQWEDRVLIAKSRNSVFCMIDFVIAHSIYNISYNIVQFCTSIIAFQRRLSRFR